MPYGTKLSIPPTILDILAAQQEPYKNAQLLIKNVCKFSRKSQKNGPLAENDKTQRAGWLGRKTRKEIGKGNPMTALRFQTGGGGRQQAPTASLQGVNNSKCIQITWNNTTYCGHKPTLQAWFIRFVVYCLIFYACDSYWTHENSQCCKYKCKACDSKLFYINCASVGGLREKLFDRQQAYILYMIFFASSAHNHILWVHN